MMGMFAAGASGVETGYWVRKGKSGSDGKSRHSEINDPTSNEGPKLIERCSLVHFPNLWCKYSSG